MNPKLPPDVKDQTIHLKGPLVALTALLFAVFVGLRFYDLGARPMHNDEGVNAWFLINLVSSANYKYDPDNYHGPSLYYIQLIPTWINGLIIEGPKKFSFRSLAGITDRSVRTGVALAGILLLLGILFTYNRIGPWGALVAFLLTGISCDFLYFSRYFIHEIFFVLFMLGMYLGATYYLDTGKKRFFYLLVFSAVLLFCTKETSVITYFVMGFSMLCAEAANRFLKAGSTTPFSVSVRSTAHKFWDGLIYQCPDSIVVSVLIWAFLYISYQRPFHFLSFHDHAIDWGNFKGLVDSFKTYFKWTREGMESGHAKPFFYWIKNIFLQYEVGLTALSVVGAGAAIVKNEKRGLYILFWTLGMVGAYSLIPYKTVWCVLNMLLPMALLSGYGVQAIIDSILTKPAVERRGPLLVLAAAVLGVSLYQVPYTCRVCYVEHDKEWHEQPYVHTSRDISNLVKEITRLGEASRMGKDIRVAVVSTVYWPLPYYLRKFTQVGYYGKLEGIKILDTPLVVAAKSQSEEIKPLLKGPYATEEFTLRSNFPVLLYASLDLFKKEFPPPQPIPQFFPARSPQTAEANGSFQPGLLKKLYIDRRCEGQPLATSLDYKELNLFWADELEKPILSPFSYEWDGYLQASQNGTYRFTLESDDGSEMWLDDVLTVDNGGTHALVKKSQDLNLAAGFHKLRLTYFDSGGGAAFNFKWTQPGQSEELVKPKYFFHMETYNGR